MATKCVHQMDAPAEIAASACQPNRCHPSACRARSNRPRTAQQPKTQTPPPPGPARYCGQMQRIGFNGWLVLAAAGSVFSGAGSFSACSNGPCKPRDGSERAGSRWRRFPPAPRSGAPISSPFSPTTRRPVGFDPRLTIASALIAAVGAACSRWRRRAARAHGRRPAAPCSGCRSAQCTIAACWPTASRGLSSGGSRFCWRRWPSGPFSPPPACRWSPREFDSAANPCGRLAGSRHCRPAFHGHGRAEDHAADVRRDCDERRAPRHSRWRSSA